MAANSKIEWTHHTFNPWIGCTKVHEGCANCYAEADMDHRRSRAKWGPKGTRSRTADEYWRQPLKWDREAKAAGERRRVFCASLADVFEDWQGSLVDASGKTLYQVAGDYVGKDKPPPGQAGRLARLDDLRRDLFALIDATPNLDWLLLTKRPENIRRMWQCKYGNAQCEDDGCKYRRRENVWLGTSVSNQATADKQIPELLKCRDLASVLFISAEPLLGPIEFRYLQPSDPPVEIDAINGTHGVSRPHQGRSARLDWIIVGGESGPNARPMHPHWASSIRDQCAAGGIAFFFKQWGEYAPESAGGFFSVGDKRMHSLDELGRLDKPHGGLTIGVRRIGKKNAGRLLDGVEWSEFPQVHK